MIKTVEASRLPNRPGGSPRPCDAEEAIVHTRHFAAKPDVASRRWP
jgi:hypothetical protein